MIQINIHEAKTHLSRYARLVKGGQTIILCDHNKPFAEIKPLRGVHSVKRQLGMDRNLLDEGWEIPFHAADTEIGSDFLGSNDLSQ